MKKIILSCILFAGILCTAHAADYIRLNNEDIDEYCMQMTETLTVSVDPVWQSTLLSHRWVLLGDLKMASGYNATDHTIQVVCPQNGYGKGRITYRYSTTGCSTSESIDIYKLFTPSADLEIEGPRCVEAGDVVVYSIEPILTVNLDDQIGMDHYYWNINDTTHRPYFVDSVYYTAGDGSSVTFKIKELNDDSVNTISLYLGQCNNGDVTKKITLPLVKQAPKPQFNRYEYCLPYGRTQVELEIINALPETVKYTWFKPNAYTFISSNSDSTHVIIETDNISAEDILVSARYKNSTDVECATTQTQIKINRRWGENVLVNTSSCFSVGSNGYYSFTIDGEIPSGAGIQWSFPSNHWEIFNSSELTDFTVNARPLSSASLIEQVIATEVIPCDGEYTPHQTTFTAYIVPAEVELSGTTCVSSGNSYTYSVTRKAGAIGPMAEEFEWYINGYVLNNQRSNSINLLIADSIRTISVKPLGKSSECYAEMSNVLEIHYIPTAPTGIVWTNQKCVNSGMNDTLYFTITGAQSNLMYSWDLSSAQCVVDTLDISSDHNMSSLRVITDGTEGLYTLSATVDNTSGCGSVSSVSVDFEIGEVGFYLESKSSIFYYVTTVNSGNLDIQSYEWYFDTEKISNTDEFFVFMTGPTYYTKVIVTTTDGCKHCYILPVNQNPSDVPYRNRNTSDKKLQLIPNPAQTEVLIEFPQQAKQTTISLFSASGQLIKNVTASEQQTTISIEGLSNGTYPIVVNQDGEISADLLIIKH